MRGILFTRGRVRRLLEAERLSGRLAVESAVREIARLEGMVRTMAPAWNELPEARRVELNSRPKSMKGSR